MLQLEKKKRQAVTNTEQCENRKQFLNNITIIISKLITLKRQSMVNQIQQKTRDIEGQNLKNSPSTE